ncbi:MAG TPA: hypothetical protein VNJ01_18330 [Bacteriovoracaceae bacterium]|nr:hypothetical protein [Bacteriovoracaceae bacterium]
MRIGDILETINTYKKSHAKLHSYVDREKSFKSEISGCSAQLSTLTERLSKLSSDALAEEFYTSMTSKRDKREIDCENKY